MKLLKEYLKKNWNKDLNFNKLDIDSICITEIENYIDYITKKKMIFSEVTPLIAIVSLFISIYTFSASIANNFSSAIINQLGKIDLDETLQVFQNVLAENRNTNSILGNIFIFLWISWGGILIWNFCNKYRYNKEIYILYSILSKKVCTEKYDMNKGYSELENSVNRKYKSYTRKYKH